MKTDKLDTCTKGQERDAEKDMAWLGALVTTRSCLIAKYWIKRAQALEIQRREDMELMEESCEVVKMGNAAIRKLQAELERYQKIVGEWLCDTPEQMKADVFDKAYRAEKAEAELEQVKTLLSEIRDDLLELRKGCEQAREQFERQREHNLVLAAKNWELIGELEQAKAENAVLREGLEACLGTMLAIADTNTKGELWSCSCGDGIICTLHRVASKAEKALSTTSAEHAERVKAKDRVVGVAKYIKQAGGVITAAVMQELEESVDALAALEVTP